MTVPATDSRPNPSAFYAVGGSLRTDAPSYVERCADRELYEALLRHEFCYILTSRQMGKSSLMIRTVHRLRQEGTRAVVLDLTAIGSNLTAEQWYLGLLDRLGEQLGLEAELDEYWQAHRERGPLQRWMAALRHVVLARLAGSLVIFIDEIDAVRLLPFSTDEFFAAIRECYNRRADEEAFRSLTFCLLGVAAPSDLIGDPRLTPFNIGRRIDLTDFTAEEAASLAIGLLPNPTVPFPEEKGETANLPSPSGERLGVRLLWRILYWTDGHPYLTQRLCAAVAGRLATASQPPTAGHQSRVLVDSVCSELFLTARARERDDNLLFVRERLLRSEVDLVTLLDTYARVRGGKRVTDDAGSGVVTALRLSGAVKGVGGRLRVRNRIYAHVFDAVWVRENLPYAELWRQQRAYRRGLVRALVGSSVALAVLGSLTYAALHNAVAARTERDQSNRLLYDANANLMQAAWNDNNVWRIQQLLDETQSFPDRGFEWDYWQRQCHRDRMTLSLPTAAESSIRNYDIWTDGRNMVTCVVSQLPGVQPSARNAYPFVRTVAIRDALTGRERLPLKGLSDTLPSPTFPLDEVLFSPDGERILTRNEDHVSLWDTATGRQQVVALPRLQFLALSPRGERVTSGKLLFDTAHPDRRIPLVPGHVNGVGCAAFSRDGRRLVTGGDDHNAVVWDGVTGRELAILEGHTDAVRAAAFSPDGRRIITGSADHTARIWDAATGRLLMTLPGHSDSVDAVAWSANGRRIVTGSNDSTVRLWDAATGQALRTLKGHTLGLRTVSFSPDGSAIVSIDKSFSVKVWDADTGCDAVSFFAAPPTNKAMLEPHLAALFHGDPKRFWTAWRARIRVRDAQQARYFQDYDHTFTQFGTNMLSVPFCAALSPDGRKVVTASLGLGPRDHQARVWDADTGRLLLTLNGHRDRVTCVAFLPDSARIVTASLDRTARIWDATTGRELVTCRDGSGGILAIALSPDGRRLATSAFAYSYPAGQPFNKGGAVPVAAVKVWDVATGAATLSLPPGTLLTPSVAFTPDGRSLMTCDLSGTTLWDLHTMQKSPLHVGGFVGPLNAPPVFMPDGRRILIWPSETAELTSDAYPDSAMEMKSVTLLRGHRQAITCAAVSADGKRIVTGSQDNTVKLWDAATGRELLTLRGAPSAVTSVGISRDGRRIVMGSQDDHVTVWSAANPQPPQKD